MSEMVMVRLDAPAQGLAGDRLLPAHVAWALLAAGQASDPRDRFGNRVESPALSDIAPAPSPAPEAPKSAYKTRAMRGR